MTIQQRKDAIRRTADTIRKLRVERASLSWRIRELESDLKAGESALQRAQIADAFAPLEVK